MSEGHPVPGRQLLVARVGAGPGGRLIGIDARRIARILAMLPLWRPPTMPAPLRGFAALAGGTVPVLDAHALLGLGLDATAPPTVYAHILLLHRLGDGPAGLLVDRAEGFATPASFGDLDPAETLGGCATALFGHGEAMAYLIDPDRLLGKAEQATLATLAAEAARRGAEWEAAA